ncbi:MAG: hypothetical protein M1530_00730 [Candidatus Marsarchaeota archaeon]|nr:hypothetical protein [Candidatus Marsarchaeota archaeon]
MPPVYNPTAKPTPTPADSPGASTASAQSKNFAERRLFFFSSKPQVILQGSICHTYSELIESVAGREFKPSAQTDFFKWLVGQEPKLSSLDMGMLKDTAILSFHRLQVSMKRFDAYTIKQMRKTPEEVIATQTDLSYAVRDYKAALNLLYELLLIKRMFELERVQVSDENKASKPLSAECKELCAQSLRKAIEFRLQDFYWETGEAKRKEEIMRLLADLPPEVRGADRDQFFAAGLNALKGISLELEGMGELRRHSESGKEIEIPLPIPFSQRYSDLVKITYQQEGGMFDKVKASIGWSDGDLAKIRGLSPKELEVFNVHLALASYSYDLTKYFGMLFATALDETRLKGEPTSHQVQKITKKARYPKFAPARADLREEITLIIDSLRDLPRIFEKLDLIAVHPVRERLASMISSAHVGPFKRFVHWYLDFGDTKVGKALDVVAKASVLLEVASGIGGMAKWDSMPKFLDFFRGDLEQVGGVALFVLVLASAPRWALKLAYNLAKRIHRI